MTLDGDDPIDIAIRTIRFGVAKTKADATERVEVAEAQAREWRQRAEAAEAGLLGTQTAADDGLKVGDQVEKYSGDYALPGQVVAKFVTKAGKLRYVVEHDPGFLHIYGPQNIRLLVPPK